MNTATGETYELLHYDEAQDKLIELHEQAKFQVPEAVSPDIKPSQIGDRLDPRVMDLIEEDKMTEDERRADEALRQGAPIVLVDAAVVQKLRLGERELRRRKQRR